MTSDVNQNSRKRQLLCFKERGMDEFHLLKNESISFLIDSGYYVDYQVNKGKVFIWFVMLF